MQTAALSDLIREEEFDSVRAEMESMFDEADARKVKLGLLEFVRGQTDMLPQSELFPYLQYLERITATKCDLQIAKMVSVWTKRYLNQHKE